MRRRLADESRTCRLAIGNGVGDRSQWDRSRCNRRAAIQLNRDRDSRSTIRPRAARDDKVTRLSRDDLTNVINLIGGHLEKSRPSSPFNVDSPEIACAAERRAHEPASKLNRNVHDIDDEITMLRVARLRTSPCVTVLWKYREPVKWTRDTIEERKTSIWVFSCGGSAELASWGLKQLFHCQVSECSLSIWDQSLIQNQELISVDFFDF